MLLQSYLDGPCNCVVCATWLHLVGSQDEGSMNGKCLSFARFLLSGQMLLPPIYMQGS
jgi:hypothetical protein